MATLSARGYSEEQVDAIEGIVEGSMYLESKSDFIRVTSEYALFTNVEDYEPSVDNFDLKVQELGLHSLDYDELDYFDFLTTVHSMSEDPEVSDTEFRETVKDMAENALEENFEDTSYVFQRLE